MQDKIFLDTNILIYSLGKDKYKKDIALNLLKQKPVITIQVLNEFSNITLRKLSLPCKDISDLLDLIIQKCQVKLIDISTIKSALTISETYKYSYYDSLIISSALESSCNILYTEDMQQEQIIENTLKILNPFI